MLLGIEKTLTEQIYHQVADLLNLQVDLLFFDTTSTYFQTGEPDERVARDEHGHRDPDPAATPVDNVRDVGFRTHGKSKDHRDDLPQVEMTACRHTMWNVPLVSESGGPS